MNQAAFVPANTVPAEISASFSRISFGLSTFSEPDPSGALTSVVSPAPISSSNAPVSSKTAASLSKTAAVSSKASRPSSNSNTKSQDSTADTVLSAQLTAPSPDNIILSRWTVQPQSIQSYAAPIPADAQTVADQTSIAAMSSGPFAQNAGAMAPIVPFPSVVSPNVSSSTIPSAKSSAPSFAADQSTAKTQFNVPLTVAAEPQNNPAPSAKISATSVQSDSTRDSATASAPIEPVTHNSDADTSATYPQTPAALDTSSSSSNQVPITGGLAPTEIHPQELRTNQPPTRADKSATRTSPSAATTLQNAPVSGDAPQTLASLSPSAPIQSAIVGMSEITNPALPPLLSLDKSESTIVPSQSVAKTSPTDSKKARETSKTAQPVDANNITTTSPHELLHVNELSSVQKVENPVAQNQAAQSGVIAQASGNAPVFPAPASHSNVASNISDAPLTGSYSLTQPAASMTAPLGSVQTANLVQHLSQTELHVGIQSGEFGKIDIHTAINQSQISARIYVEHDDLGKVMAGALPQLHEKLSVEHRMDAQIQLYNTGSGHSSGADRQQQQPQQQATQGQNGPASRDADDPRPFVENVQESANTAATGLDMHI